MANGPGVNLSAAQAVRLALAPERVVALRPALHGALGMPKSGLRLRTYDDGSRLVISGRADPTFLYVVFGTALAVTVVGTALGSPPYGFLGATLFSVLFSPLLLFAALTSVRLRTRCVVNRSARAVSVMERSYLGNFARVWPLDSLDAVVVITAPPSGWLLRSPLYQIQIVFGSERYLVDVGATERAVLRRAQRIARFAGVPIAPEQMPSSRGGWGLDAVLALGLFLLPVIGSMAAFAYLFRDRTASVDGLLVSVAALIVAQISALLAFAYRRARAGNAD